MNERHCLRPMSWILVGFLTGSAVLAEVPDRIDSPLKSPSNVLWLSEELAFSPSGELRSELFSSSELSMLRNEVEGLRRARARAVDGSAETACPLIQVGDRDFAADRPTLAQVFEEAKLVVLGELAAVEQGVFYGQFVTLYELRIETVAKAPASWSAPESLLFVGVRFDRVVDGTRVCLAGSRFPHEPTLGRRVLILARAIPVESPVVLNPLEDELYFEIEGGVASLPWAKATGLPAGVSWAEVERQLFAVQDKRP